MDLLVFAANLLFVATYFVNDLLRLRLLSVVACVCLAIYFATLPQPMTTVLGWNLFFVALNLVQIARLLIARRTRPAALPGPAGQEPAHRTGRPSSSDAIRG